MSITLPELERMAQIEAEREEVMGNPLFQQWMQELNVSRSYTDNTPIFNARDMMVGWDADRYAKNYLAKK